MIERITSKADFLSLTGKPIFVYLRGSDIAVKVTKKELRSGIKNCSDNYNSIYIKYIENGAGYFITNINASIK